LADFVFNPLLVHVGIDRSRVMTIRGLMPTKRGYVNDAFCSPKAQFGMADWRKSMAYMFADTRYQIPYPLSIGPKVAAERGAVLREDGKGYILRLGECRYHGQAHIAHWDYPFRFFLNPFRQRYRFTKLFFGGTDFLEKLEANWHDIEIFCTKIQEQLATTVAVDLPDESYSVTDRYPVDYDDPMSGPFTIEEFTRGFWKMDEHYKVWWTPPPDLTHPSLWDTDPDLHRDYIVHQLLRP